MLGIAPILPATAGPTAGSVPLPPPPPVPAGPVARSIGDAYRAIVTAAPANPAAAQQASFLYAQARERAARGDYAGALAAADSAQALARSRPATVLAPVVTPGAFSSGSAPSGPAVAAPGSAAAVPDAGLLPGDLLAARNEIELAERIGHASLAAAKARYRNALNAYLDGNAARSHSEARASFDLAAEVLSKAK